MNTLWIPAAALTALEREADRAFPRETGGVLVGYGAGDAIVVRDVLGPGPMADHRRIRFEPDHIWQCAELDRMYSRSEGRHVYLGDWHTHPHGSLGMSTLDKKTLAAIARHRDARLMNPVMLIGASEPAHWQWRAHVYLGRGRFSLFSQFGTCSVQQYANAEDD